MRLYKITSLAIDPDILKDIDKLLCTSNRFRNRSHFIEEACVVMLREYDGD